MNDRLADLRAAAPEAVALEVEDSSAAAQGHLKKRGSTFAQPQFMIEFFQDVDIVKVRTPLITSSTLVEPIADFLFLLFAGRYCRHPKCDQTDC